MKRPLCWGKSNMRDQRWIDCSLHRIWGPKSRFAPTNEIYCFERVIPGIYLKTVQSKAERKNHQAVSICDCLYDLKGYEGIQSRQYKTTH